MPIHSKAPIAQTMQATTMADDQPNSSAINGVSSGANIPTPFPPVLSIAHASPPLRFSRIGAVVQKIPSHTPSEARDSENQKTIAFGSVTETPAKLKIAHRPIPPNA